MSKYKKRKDGRYQLNIECGHDDFGKRVRKTIYGTTIKELKEKEFETRQKLNNKIISKNNPIIFHEMATIWYQDYTSDLSESTKLRYKSIIDNQLSCMMHLKLNKINTSTIQKLLNNLQTTGYSTTIKLTKIVMNKIFNTAILCEYISQNPVTNTILPKYNTEKRRALTSTELTAIKSTTEFTIKEKCYVYLGLYAGLRQGEILALSKDDIDLVNKTILINKTMTYPNNNGIIQQHTKTTAGLRIVKIPYKLVEFLEIYLNTIDDRYLFITKSGKLYSKTAKKNLWEQILKKINLHMPENEQTNITTHFLRHNYATDLYYSGIGVKDAQYLLGHKDLVTTLNIYTELDKQKINLDLAEDYWNKEDKMVVSW